MEKDKINENAGVIMELIGEENFVKICKVYGGGSVYIPTYSSMIRDKRNEDIIKRYNGFNVKRLASEYRLSEYHIRRILKENDI